MKRPAVSLIALLSCVATASAAPSELIMFGDSLSDVGNVWDQTFHLAPQSPPYFNGRYSNGVLWGERLAADLEITVPTPSRLSGRNYSYAGTKTGSGSTFIFPFSFPNIGSQINSYLAGNTPNASQLFTVWGGGNDFIDGQTNPSIPANNIASHVTALANAGARQFIVPNLPPLGEIPRFRGTANQTVMNSRSAQFNDTLSATLNSLEISLNVQIWQLDVEGFFQQVLADPGAFGFTNVTSPALVGGTPAPNQDEYLFWDDIHPTRIGHRFLGDAAFDLIRTHNWSSTQTSANWSDPSNWDPSGTPAADWIANVVNVSVPAGQSAVIAGPSTVSRVLVRGQAGQMDLVVSSGASLNSTSISIGASGAIELAGGVVSAPVVEVQPAGALRGTGTVLGDVINAGLVGPAAALAVDGSFTQATGGTLRIDLGGTQIGQFDRLEVEGSAALAGSLEVGLSGGFIALPGDSFEVLLFDARTGDVEITNATGFSGLDFTKTYSSSSLTLGASATGGDANLDGSVNLLDFNILAGSFGQSGLNWLSGDFTGDGLVGLADFDVLAGNFGQSLAGQELTPEMWATLANAVPEPAAALPVMLLMGVLSHRRRVMR